MKWKKGAPYGVFETEVLDEMGKVIATVWTQRLNPEMQDVEPWPEGERNLDLIIAAPELLEELEYAAARLDFLTNWIENTYGGTNRDVELGRSYARAARTAITKARGKS